MQQLTKHELHELAMVWDDLSRLRPENSPPVTEDEMTEADLDALIAGVISSNGRLDAAGLAEFEAVVSRGADSNALAGILRRLAVLLRLTWDG
jgi:hypothetical protein